MRLLKLVLITAVISSLIPATTSSYLDLDVRDDNDSYGLNELNQTLEDRITLAAFRLNRPPERSVNITFQLNETQVYNWINQEPEKFEDYTVGEFKKSLKLYQGNRLEKKNWIINQNRYIVRVNTTQNYFVVLENSSIEDSSVIINERCKELGNKSYLDYAGVEYKNTRSCENTLINNLISLIEKNLIPIISGLIISIALLYLGPNIARNTVGNKTTEDQKLSEINHLTDMVKAHPDKFTDEEMQKIFEANKKASEGELEQAYQIIEEIEQEKK